jgi:virginiamycin B lyase
LSNLAVRGDRVSKLILLLSVCALASAQSVGITEYPLVAGATPWEITAGPDGALWFTELQANKIGRITTVGTLSEYVLPTPNSGPLSITTGPDGALWFTEQNINSTGDQIGRITTGGMITEFPVPTSNGQTGGITAGPDGALWFTESAANQIGRITTGGAVNEYPVPTAQSFPFGIVAGSDGALWFTEETAGQIGRITTGGTFIEYPIPASASYPYRIAAGPDGALWFTESGANQIGRITTSGAISQYPTPTSGLPFGIASGADNAIWFVEYPSQIGEITINGAITEYTIPTPNSYPAGITAGPDGAMWFTEYQGQNIGRVGVLLSQVNNVTSSTANGTYLTGQSISIQMSFSGAVTVTGTPQLALNSGGTAKYSSGSGSTTLTFIYNIGGSDSSAHLDYASTSALTLNGGTIADANLIAANLALPAPGAPGSLGANTSIVIGAKAPAAFFNGEVSLGSGVYYLQFPNGALFGYYNFPSFPILYHYDLGFESFIDAHDASADAYLYDFASGHWFYTGPSLFPYLYDFTLNGWLYYFPAATNPGHYTTNPRYFSNTVTGNVFTM